MDRNIAFLGTGIMGAPLAVHLLRAGFAVCCYNRTASKTAPVVEAGGVACASAAEAAREADVIITMVTDGPDVEQVLFGENGALETAPASTLIVDMSTISPLLTRSMAQRANERGFEYLDAPVTGGEIGAQKGALSIMVGGSPENFARARPILAPLAAKITHCGAIGAGQSVKLCNQICGALNLLGVCEALTLGEKMGVDPRVIVEVVSAGAGSNWSMQNLAPKINSGDFAPGFMIDTQQKDMRLLAEAAEAAQVPLPGSSIATQIWRAAQAHGYGHEGIQSMIKVLWQMAALAKDKTEISQ